MSCCPPALLMSACRSLSRSLELCCSIWSLICVTMNAENFLIWNVRGLNSRARRNVVKELVGEHRASLISFQETKLDTCTNAIVRDLLGLSFDYFSLPATNTRRLSDWIVSLFLTIGSLPSQITTSRPSPQNARTMHLCCCALTVLSHTSSASGLRIFGRDLRVIWKRSLQLGMRHYRELISMLSESWISNSEPQPKLSKAGVQSMLEVYSCNLQLPRN